jgi:hypothetical protein
MRSRSGGVISSHYYLETDCMAGREETLCPWLQYDMALRN